MNIIKFNLDELKNTKNMNLEKQDRYTIMDFF